MDGPLSYLPSIAQVSYLLAGPSPRRVSTVRGEASLCYGLLPPSDMTKKEKVEWIHMAHFAIYYVARWPRLSCQQAVRARYIGLLCQSLPPLGRWLDIDSFPASRYPATIRNLAPRHLATH